MQTLFLLMLPASIPEPSTLVDAPIDLGRLDVHEARQMHGQRCRFRVWRTSLIDDTSGRPCFDAWNRHGLHCFVRMASGEKVPNDDDGYIVLQGRLRVWDVPSFEIDGRRVEGWVMIRVENAAVR